MEVGGPFLCLREASALPSKESQDRWAVYLTRNPGILASTPFYSTLKAVLYFSSVGTGSSAGHWLCWTILHSNQAAQTQSQWKAVMEHTEGGLSALHCVEGEGYVRRPEDSRRENPAEFLYSIYYTSFTRRVYELEKKKKFTLVGFLSLVPPWSEPPETSKEEASVSHPHSEASSAMPDCVVLTFLSKHQNKMFLLKEPMQGCREAVRESLEVAARQEKKEEWKGEEERVGGICQWV